MIKSKPATKDYRANYDRIFGKLDALAEGTHEEEERPGSADLGGCETKEEKDQCSE